MALSSKAIKKVKRWIKWLIGRDVYRRPQVTVPTERFGDPGGELWTIATAGLHRGTVLYTFGVGTDIGFERAVIARFGLSVHAFDPTPIALEWVGSQRLPDRFVLHPFGVADYDGTAQFAGPSSEKYISYSLVRRSGLGAPVDAPVRRIATLHNELRLPAPDIVKMDIEGAEYGVLADMLKSGYRPSQILVEYHHRWRETGARKTLDSIALLNQHGFRIAFISKNGMEYTFVRLQPANQAPVARTQSS